MRRLQWSKVATGRLEGELSALDTRSHGVVKRIEAEHPALLLTLFRKLTQQSSAKGRGEMLLFVAPYFGLVHYDLSKVHTKYSILFATIIMFPAVVRQRSSGSLPFILIRSLATEHVSSPLPDLPLVPPQKYPQKTTKPRLYPHPRTAEHNQNSTLPKLPPRFGRNQLLPVSSSTRALLESIVDRFDAPIRYAFAYGSGVFEQDGYAASSTTEALVGPGAPMLDFMFAVTHPAHFHSINMHQNPSHYPLHARTLGSSYVSKIGEIGPGVWFNAYVPVNGVVCPVKS